MITDSESVVSCNVLLNRLTKSEEIKEIILLALEISERKCSNGLEVIMKKIEDNLTLNYRGTLLYACSVYDCSDYFLTLVTNLIEGAYEASIEAYYLLVENVDYNRIGLADKKIAFNRLKECESYMCAERENIEVIQEFLEFLKRRCYE